MVDWSLCWLRTEAEGDETLLAEMVLLMLPCIAQRPLRVSAMLTQGVRVRQATAYFESGGGDKPE